MKKVQIPAAFFVLIITLFMLCFFRTMPQGQLWKGYSVLYVSASADEKEVVDCLESSGIDRFAAYSSQYLPVTFSSNSPEIAVSMATGILNDSYLKNRNNYFFDFSKQFKVYYIESSFLPKINDCVKLLKSQGISCGLDSKASYPVVLPFLFLIVFGILCIFSRHKLIFSLSSVYPCIFVLTNPFYTAFTTSGLLLLGIFLCTNLWRRKGAVEVLLHKNSLLVMLIISLVSAFSCSILSGFIFILVVLSTASVCLLIYNFQLYREQHQIFVPVLIHSAKKISLFAGKARIILPVMEMSFALALLFALLFSDSSSVSSKNAKILLPSSEAVSAEGKGELPDLSAYTDFVCKIETAPYKSLNKTYSGSEETVTFPRYLKDGDKIVKENETLAYDEKFREDAIAGIDNLQFYSIEKVMKSQGSEFNPGYKSSQSYTNSFFSVLMMLFCFFLLLFIYISIIIRKRF